MSLKVVAKRVYNENKIAEVLAIYQKLVAEVRKEDGCIEYHLYQDFKYPNLFIMIEEWRDLAAFKVHGAASALKTYGPLLEPYAIKPLEINVLNKSL